MGVRSHDDIVAHLGCLDSAFASSPGHDCGVRSRRAFKNLVPANDFLSFSCKEFLHSFHHIALEIMLGAELIGVLETEFLYLGLADRTFLPAYFRTFVSAYVNVFRREQSGDFCKHILEEYHCLLLACAEYIVRHAPSSPDFVRTSGTAELRVCSEGGKHVAGQVDFRDDGYAFFCGIFYHGLYLVLSVVSAVRDIVISVPVLSDDSSFANRTLFGQFRIPVNLHSPSLVVGEMPVKHIHLVYGHHVKDFLDFSHIEEMSCDIEMLSPVCKSRRVLYGDAREGPVLVRSRGTGIDFNRKHLLQRLNGVEESVV